MDRQEISQETHHRLLYLTAPAAKRAVSRSWRRYAALAACCALVLSLGVWRWILPGAGQTGPSGGPAAGIQVGSGGDGAGGLAVEGTDREKLMFPDIPHIYYQDLTEAADMAASLAFPDGSYDVELTPQDIQTIFWGPEGRPNADHPKQEQGTLPWILFWEGYTVTGRATYDGEGELFWLHLWGEHPDGGEFTLTLSPGQLPPSCLVDPDREISDVNGVAVTGWSRTYDRDGDGVTDYVCGSEFMAGEVGVRFENVGSPFQSDYGGQSDLALEGAAQFNALFVRQALAEEGGLYLDRLMTNGDIPAWREQPFSSLAQARQEAAFAPYLPRADIPGYGEFYGRLSYQAGNYNYLFVRWSRGYDDVEVDVRLPEDGTKYAPVNIEEPAGYDVRLYAIPWGDSVPDQYDDTFYNPVFRSADMSRGIVEARAYTVADRGDTDGPRMNFSVLHPDGTLVEYHCKGITVDQVWALVKDTLE